MGILQQREDVFGMGFSGKSGKPVGFGGDGLFLRMKVE